MRARYDWQRVCKLRKSGRRSRRCDAVRRVTIVFWLVIEPHMQPRNARARRAQPHGFGADALAHLFTYEFPKFLLLYVMCFAHKGCEMPVHLFRAVRDRGDENGT